MPLTLNEILGSARTLTPDQRLDLANRIYDTVEAEAAHNSPCDLHPDWYPELERRSQDIRAGNVKAIPAEEVFAEVDRLIESL